MTWFDRGFVLRDAVAAAGALQMSRHADVAVETWDVELNVNERLPDAVSQSSSNSRGCLPGRCPFLVLESLLFRGTWMVESTTLA